MATFTRLKEYLSTDDGTAGQLLIPRVILPMMQEDQKKNLLDRSLAKFVVGPAQVQGAVFNYNQTVRNTGRVRQVGEGAEIGMDSQDYTTVTFTPIKYGVSVRITREMMEDSQFELFRTNIAAMGRRFAENETRLILTALDNADTTITGGAAITVANITQSMLNLREDDYVPSDLIVGNEVLNDLMNIDLFNEANKWGDASTYARTGFVGRIYGLNVHVFSSNAAPATTYTRRAYVIDRSEAFGIAIKRDITVENYTLPLYDMEAACLTQRIDVRILRAEAVGLITTS